MGGKFKFSPQESDLAHFVGIRTEVKIPSGIKLPLRKYVLTDLNSNLEMSYLSHDQIS